MMFKKKSPIDLRTLPVKSKIRYNKTNWIIHEFSYYDWGIDGRSVEYKIIANNRTAYIEVERHDNTYEIYFSELVSINQTELESAIQTKTIHYNGDQFILDQHYNGSVKNETLGESWAKVKTYMFYSEKNTILTIEKIADLEFCAYFGLEISERDLKI